MVHQVGFITRINTEDLHVRSWAVEIFENRYSNRYILLKGVYKTWSVLSTIFVRLG
jgi:hypothetical protein